MLTTNYYGNIMILPVGFYLYLIITDFLDLNNDEAPTTGEEVLSWLIIEGAHILLWLPPALTLSLYLLTGSGDLL